MTEKPKRCVKRKRTKPSDGGLEDRLSSLPNEILLAILSRLNIQEAARTSVVSRKWKQLWHCHPNLSFEHPRFDIKRVINNIIEQHIGPSIDEFKVISDFYYIHSSIIDKWVDFAFKKNVKTLHLRLTPHLIPGLKPYTLQLPLQNRNRNFDTFHSTLKSLYLDNVQVPDEIFQLFPSCFPLLEDLRLRCADNLRNTRSCSSLHLKHLEVVKCRSLEVIDLCVPQLSSFHYKGYPVDLHLRNASSLSAVSVRSVEYLHYPLAYAFGSFLAYYSQQLEYLELEVISEKQWKKFMGSSPYLLLPNLKHLSLYVVTDQNPTLTGWAPLIAASPVLQKLTLQFAMDSVYGSEVEKAPFDSRPLNCLKTLEIVGFKGYPVDLEFAIYIVENAILLEEVILNPSYLRRDRRLNETARQGVLKLEGRLPKTAKLIVK